MPTVCSTVLSADLKKDCNNLPVGNAEPLMWAITKEDWNNATKSYDADGNLTSITLGTGKKSFQFEVYKNGHKPSFETVDGGDYPDTFNHQIATSFQNYTNATKKQIPALISSKSVFIVENVQKTTDAVFEIYGTGQGLRLQPGAKRDLAANAGVFTGTFANDKDQYEAGLPISFVVTDMVGGMPVFSYNKTKAAIVALTTAAT